MRISDWSSDVCSSDLRGGRFSRKEFRPSCASCEPIACCTAGRVHMSRMLVVRGKERLAMAASFVALNARGLHARIASAMCKAPSMASSEEHTSELQSLMRTSYVVFCYKKNTDKNSN